MQHSCVSEGEVMKRQFHGREELPYSYLVDNIKTVLIFLVVYNHMIALQQVRISPVIRSIWYIITIFHMPAFVFVSGYLSKHPQHPLKVVRNILIPYIFGYTIHWCAYLWNGQKIDYELLRPTGTAMWYLLALFVYRLTIEAMGKIRFIIPLSILLALWAGTRPEFSTYLSVSRIVVFFPFFVAGYLWQYSSTQKIRKFKGKWFLLLFCVALLCSLWLYMSNNDLPVDLFRENHSYQISGVTNLEGIVLRSIMYIVSYTLIITFFALFPEGKLFPGLLGKNTMSIFIFHYPILMVLNWLDLLKLPIMLNWWAPLVLSLVFILVLGSPPVNWLYNGIIYLISLILFKKNSGNKAVFAGEEAIDDLPESDYA